MAGHNASGALPVCDQFHQTGHLQDAVLTIESEVHVYKALYSGIFGSDLKLQLTLEHAQRRDCDRRSHCYRAAVVQ
jgi:hypothetical protein